MLQCGGPAHLVGFGKLRLAQLSIEAFTEVCVTVDRIYGDCSSTARNLRVADSSSTPT